LILGVGSSAIGTLVERTTRFTMLLHLPRMAEHGQLRVHNGPALAGHGAEAVRDAIASTITTRNCSEPCRCQRRPASAAPSATASAIP
jgi:hypothetical protein